MIRSNLRRLRFEKEEKDAIKLTIRQLVEVTGLSSATLVRLLKTEPVERVDGNTMNVLCRYFDCNVGDLLEYVPDSKETANHAG